MLGLASHLGSFTATLGFSPAEDSHRKQLRRFFTLSIILVLGSSTVLIGAASLMKATEITGHAPFISSSKNLLSKDVILSAQPVSVDPESRTIIIDWYPRMALEASQSCSEYLTNPIIREFHISPILLDDSSPGWRPTPFSSEPLFTLNQTAQCMGSIPISYTSFRTVTKLSASPQLIESQISRISGPQNYPFDKYIAPLALYVKDPTTGKWEAPFISQFVGAVVNFEVALGQSVSVADTYGNYQLLIELRIQRSKVVQAFVVATVIVNWLMANAFLIIVAATLVYSQLKICFGAVVVPVGALFAFTSIRVNLPGAPDGFGTTLDMFSILPVLIIISLCSFALLLIVLYQRIAQIPRSDSPPTKSEIKEDTCPSTCLPILGATAAATPKSRLHRIYTKSFAASR